MAWLILIMVGALVVVISYVATIIYEQSSYWKRRRMLHVKSTPIVGNNAPIIYQTVSFPQHALNLYGNCPGARYYGMFDFRRPAVVIKDPQLIREICVKSFDNFTDHRVFVTEEMDPYAGRNLFSLSGDRWKEIRRTVSPSFTTAKLKSIFDFVTECANDFVQYFEENPQIAKSFEAKEAFSRYASDVIGSVAFGVKVNSMKDRENEFFVNGQKATSFGLWTILKTELMRNFPRLMRSAGATFLPSSADRLFKRLISETMRARRETGIVRPDMVHLMMQAMNDGANLGEDDVVGQAFFFFLAGFESSASHMSFVAHELAANPDVQTKLQLEIDQWLAAGLGYESLGQMRYLDMVISEALRKYPVAPFTNRVCTRDHELPPPLDGYPSYRMEKGTVIMIPILGLHHDPDHFPDPDRFDPERFSEENKDSIKPYTYMPFGLGPRQCVGNRFALMEAKVILIHVLSKFTIKFTEKTQHPIVYGKKSFSMVAERGFWIGFEKRNKAD